jgi:hypothetical protein
MRHARRFGHQPRPRRAYWACAAVQSERHGRRSAAVTWRPHRATFMSRAPRRIVTGKTGTGRLPHPLASAGLPGKSMIMATASPRKPTARRAGPLPRVRADPARPVPAAAHQARRPAPAPRRRRPTRGKAPRELLGLRRRRVGRPIHRIRFGPEGAVVEKTIGRRAGRRDGGATRPADLAGRASCT